MFFWNGSKGASRFVLDANNKQVMILLRTQDRYLTAASEILDTLRRAGEVSL